MTTATASDAEQYLGINQASRRVGWSAQRIQRLAILGKIRTRLEPGIPPRYNAHDLDAMASLASR